MAIIKHMVTLYNTLFYLAFICKVIQLNVKTNTIIVQPAPIAVVAKAVKGAFDITNEPHPHVTNHI